MKALYALIDEHLQEYEKGSITISEDIEFSMRKTVRQITHYILSRYMDGGKDNKDADNNRRPFRNIGNAVVDLEWRAKNIDRKSIEAHATDGDHIFSLVVNKELQQWMKNNNFGKTIDDYQRKKSEYGSVLLKKTETAGELLIEPCKWELTAVDPRDIAGGMKVEHNYLSPLDLKKKSDVWTEEYEGKKSIDVVIAAARKNKSGDERRIEVLDIEGEFESHLVDESIEEEDSEIKLYNLIVAVVSNKKYCLYKTELKESRFKHDRRKDVEGRDMGLGVWEEVFEPQIWTNENVIDEREAMSIGGKTVITTNKKGMPSAVTIRNGEVVELEADEYWKPVSLANDAIPQFQNTIDAWFTNMQRDQSAYPGVTGEEPKASTPGISLELQAAQGGSIFNKRRDQDGYFLLDGLLLPWVMSFVIKQINKKHVLTASYSPRELEMLDAAIADFQAAEHAKGLILSDAIMEPGLPFGATGQDREIVAGTIREKLKRDGNKRTLTIPKGYITLDRVKQKVRFDITDEMADDQRKLNALASQLQNLAPEDPARAAIIAEMMEVQGISAASFPVAAPAQPAAAPRQAKSRVNNVLPEGQKA